MKKIIIQVNYLVKEEHLEEFIQLRDMLPPLEEVGASRSSNLTATA